MRYLCTALLLVGLAAGCAQTPHADFGMPTSLDGDTMSISQVLESPEQYDGKYLRLRGEVTGVCAKKGCWMRIAGEGSEPGGEDGVFVKFNCPISGRLIPMDALGKEAIVEGTLTTTVVPEADARHLAEDAGKSPEEVAKIVGDQVQLRIAAPGARVFGVTHEEVMGDKPTSQPKS